MTRAELLSALAPHLEATGYGESIPVVLADRDRVAFSAVVDTMLWECGAILRRLQREPETCGAAGIPYHRLFHLMGVLSFLRAPVHPYTDDTGLRCEERAAEIYHERLRPMEVQ